MTSFRPELPNSSVSGAAAGMPEEPPGFQSKLPAFRNALSQAKLSDGQTIAQKYPDLEAGSVIDENGHEVITFTGEVDEDDYSAILDLLQGINEQTGVEISCTYVNTYVADKETTAVTVGQKRPFDQLEKPKVDFTFNIKTEDVAGPQGLSNEWFGSPIVALQEALLEVATLNSKIKKAGSDVWRQNMEQMQKMGLATAALTVKSSKLEADKHTAEATAHMTQGIVAVSGAVLSAVMLGAGFKAAQTQTRGARKELQDLKTLKTPKELKAFNDKVQGLRASQKGVTKDIKEGSKTDPDLGKITQLGADRSIARQKLETAKQNRIAEEKAQQNSPTSDPAKMAANTKKLDDLKAKETNAETKYKQADDNVEAFVAQKPGTGTPYNRDMINKNLKKNDDEQIKLNQMEKDTGIADFNAQKSALVNNISQTMHQNFMVFQQASQILNAVTGAANSFIGMAKEYKLAGITIEKGQIDATLDVLRGMRELFSNAVKQGETDKKDAGEVMSSALQTLDKIIDAIYKFGINAHGQ